MPGGPGHRQGIVCWLMFRMGWFARQLQAE
jgi:hypothetical protein